MQRLALLDRFGCLGSACPDTCCRGWDMQVDAPHLALYRAERPDLAAAVDDSGAQPVMRRSGPEGTCVKFADGLCAVHAADGTHLLGDACHFYPRVTRRLDGDIRMTAALSCPEIARLALVDGALTTWMPADLDREPVSVRDIGTTGAGRVCRAFERIAGDEATTPEIALRSIVSIARSLTRLPAESWPTAISVLARMAPDGLCEPERDGGDDVRLLHALVGLIRANRHRPGERLLATVATVADGLGVRIDWDTLNLWRAEGSERRRPLPPTVATGLAPILRRWLQAQLLTAAFPYAGLGETPADRATILAVRFATLGLALRMHAVVTGSLDETTIVRVAQSLSRLLDHLAEPMLSLALYRDAGWHREARLAGLIANTISTDDGRNPPSGPRPARRDQPTHDVVMGG